MANLAALIRAENSGKNILRRGRRFIEFDNGDGSKRFVTTIDPLHVRGGETEIDTGFVPDTGAWQWKMAAGDYEFHARSVFNAGNVMEWRKGASWTIFDPQSINFINQDNSRQQIAIKQAITGGVSDNVLSFPAAYGAGRHFRYEAHPQHLRKFITIDALANLPAPTVTGTIWFEAEFSLSTSTDVVFYLDGVKWAKSNNVRVKTTSRIEIRDAATETQVLWYLEKPHATDANGDVVECEYEVRRQGGASNLFITVRVPRAWLLTAAYPVEIDPTFTDGEGGDVTTAKDTYVKSNQAVRNYGIATTFGNSASDHALVEFDLSSIAADATCGGATVYFYQANSFTASAFTYTIYSIASGNAAWIEGTLNNSQALAGEPCWNALEADGSGGVTTAWAGSAGLSTSGTDYEATSIGSFSGNRSDANGTEYSSALTAARVEDWFGGSNTNYGIKMDSSAGQGGLGTSDNATTAYRPKLVVNYTPAGGTMEQEGFRFRNDDGSESAATWKANQDANISLAKSSPFRLRTLINATGDPASSAFRLEYRRKDQLVFSDAFDDNFFNTDIWEKRYHTDDTDQLVTVLETGGVLELTPRSSVSGSSGNGAMSLASVNYVDSHMIGNMTQVVNSAAGVFCNPLWVYVDDSNGFGFSYEEDTLYFAWLLNDDSSDFTAEAYNATNHAWIKLLHQSSDDKIYWYTSANGVTWIEKRNKVNPFNLSSVRLQPFSGGTYLSVPSPGSGKFKNFSFLRNGGSWAAVA